MKITYFKDAYNTTVPHYVETSHAYQRIKNGSSRKKVEELRSKTTKEEKDVLKRFLPVIVFSGEFTTRNNKGCVKQSKKIVLDIDKIKGGTENVKNKIIQLPWVESCFVSPSGDGLKVVVKLSTENHLGHYLKLESLFENEYGIKIDKSCKDLSRACFESYDPDIYVNMNCDEFTEVFVVSETVSERVRLDFTKPITDYDKIYDYLKIWAQKKLNFVPGERHPFLIRLTAGCNKFGIPKDVARGYILYDFVEGSANFTTAEFDKIINHIYSKYSSNFGTQSFDQKTSYAYTKETNQSVYEADVFDVEDDEELGISDFIYLQDIYDDCIDNYIHGSIAASTTHFPKLDELYKLQLGEVTLIGGHGNHGKSSILAQILVLRAVKNNERFAIFSPETFPPVHFYNDLIAIYLGMSVEKQYHDRCTLEQYKKGLDFIKDHFYYLFPQKESPTAELIIRRFQEAVNKHKVNGVVIDPFNQMDREMFKYPRDDQFIGSVLSDFKRFATTNNVYFWIVAHPNTKAGIKQKGETNYPCPDVYDFAGGAVWNAKVDNVLIYYRPEFNSNPLSTIAELITKKIKRRTTGQRGTVQLDYIIKKRRFFIDGHNPMEKEPYVSNQVTIQNLNAEDLDYWNTEAPF